MLNNEGDFAERCETDSPRVHIRYDRGRVGKRGGTTPGKDNRHPRTQAVSEHPLHSSVVKLTPNAFPCPCTTCPSLSPSLRASSSRYPGSAWATPEWEWVKYALNVVCHSEHTSGPHARMKTRTENHRKDYRSQMMNYENKYQLLLCNFHSKTPEFGQVCPNSSKSGNSPFARPNWKPKA